MKTLKKIALVFVALFALALFTGCSVEGATAPDPKASSAADTKPVPSPKADPMVSTLGKVFTYTDGVSISVSQPVAWTPSQDAASIAGVPATDKTVTVTVVVTNNSKKTINLAAFPQATSGGVQATQVTDVEQNVSVTPMAPLLIGQTLKWIEGFGVANPADMTISIAPSYEYQNAIFTSK